MFNRWREPGTSVVVGYVSLLSLRLASYALFISTQQVFLRYAGISYSFICFLMAIAFVTVAIFEVPTGALADTFGRRRTYLLSCLLPTISQLLYYFWRVPISFVLAEILAGVGFALASGVLEAWAVDKLNRQVSGGNTRGLFYSGEIAARVAHLGGAIVGGLIVIIDIGLPRLIGAVGLFATFCLAWAIMDEPEQATDRAARKSWALVVDNSRQALRYISATPALRSLTLVMFPAVMVQSALIPWQALLHIKSPTLQPMWFGWLSGLLFVGALAGALLMRRSRREGLRQYRVLWTLLVAYGLLGALFGMAASFAMGAIILVGAAVVRGYCFPALSVVYNEQIPSRLRATILSFRNLVDSLGAAAVLITGGAIAGAVSPETPVIMFGCIGAVMVAVLGLSVSRTVAASRTERESGVDTQTGF